MMKHIRCSPLTPIVLTGGVLSLSGWWALAQNSSPKPQPAPQVTSQVPATPPSAQAYLHVKPGLKVVEGHTLIPVSFIQNQIGASVQTLERNQAWRLSHFAHTIELRAGETGADFDGREEVLPVAPRIINGHLYVPWVPISKLLGIKWSRPSNQPKDGVSTLLLIQYPAAYIEDIRHSVSGDKVRIVLDLSNATRVAAQYTNTGVIFNLAAARRPNVASVKKIDDRLVPSVTTYSGNWKATTNIKLNYAAPATWFTTGNPPRIVVDAQKIFEKSSSENIGGGFSLNKVFRGTGHGPVRLFVAKVDPDKGWRIRVAPAGYSVLQRNRPSAIASRSKAPFAINGGFFAFDGAAVGAVKVNGEWIRLPWKGRSAIGFDSRGKARIANMQATAQVSFSNGLQLPIRDLNGWPDRNRITALTRRFGTFVKLRPGEIAAVVDKGVVTSTPGSGGVNVPADGYVLVANGGAIPELKKASRGLKATLKISAPGWETYPSALGGGPRLLTDGQIDVRNEGFRSDVINGLAPRTAIGVDRNGQYIIVVADGRQGNYSTGLTLTEMAYTLQKAGAVDAINLDGGGSTAMVLRNRVINRPSDGNERRVSNALLVMR